MKQYNEYKDSGIEWLGQIPAHWDACKIKHVASLKSGHFISANQIEAEGTYPVYGGNGLRGYTSEFNQDGYIILIGRQGALCGNINYGDGKFWATEHAIVVTLNTKFDIFYFGELLRAMNLNQYNESAAQPGLSVGKIINLKIPKAPFNEQQTIAKFIDHQTQVIDALVAKKEALIEKLQLQRQTIINEAVTKGLHPDAPMKDSSIEWLGEIPAHWDACKIKRVASLKSGHFISANQIEAEGTYPVYGGNGLRGYTSEFNQDGYIILIGRQGAFCGNINYGDGKFWATEHAIVVTLNTKFDTFYFGELLRAMNLNQYNESAAQPGLSIGKIINLKIPKAPLEEQQAIAKFIDQQTQLIDQLISKTKVQIEKLKTYRQTIISEAVTGKIDVSGWAG